MKVKLKLKHQLDPEELTRYDFTWKTWTPEQGAECICGTIHVFTKSLEIHCTKLTQKAFDTLLKLAIAGFVEFIGRDYESEATS